MGNEKQGRKKNAEHKRYVEVPSLKQGSETNGFRLKQGLPLSASPQPGGYRLRMETTEIPPPVLRTHPS